MAQFARVRWLFVRSSVCWIFSFQRTDDASLWAAYMAPSRIFRAPGCLSQRKFWNGSETTRKTTASKQKRLRVLQSQPTSHKYKCLGQRASGSLRRIEVRVHSIQNNGQTEQASSQDQSRAFLPKTSANVAASSTYFTRRKMRARAGVYIGRKGTPNARSNVTPPTSRVRASSFLPVMNSTADAHKATAGMARSSHFSQGVEQTARDSHWLSPSS